MESEYSKMEEDKPFNRIGSTDSMAKPEFNRFDRTPELRHVGVRTAGVFVWFTAKMNALPATCCQRATGRLGTIKTTCAARGVLLKLVPPRSKVAGCHGMGILRVFPIVAIHGKMRQGMAIAGNWRQPSKKSANPLLPRF
jgi:hypothetical protein